MTEVRVFQTVNVPPARVVDTIVVAVKEDPVDALIVILMVIVPVVAPIITKLITSVMPVVAVKQVHRVRHHLHLVLVLKKVMEVRVRPTANAYQAHVVAQFVGKLVILVKNQLVIKKLV